MATISMRMKKYFITEFQNFQRLSWPDFLEKVQLVYNAGYRNGLRARRKPARYPSSPLGIKTPVRPSNGEYGPIKKET